ncbi:hypothetical protein BJX70DRAFT_66326 [Aspergillus crustosus]
MYEQPDCQTCWHPEKGQAGIARQWTEVCPGCEAVNNGYKLCDVCMEGDEEIEGVCWQCNDEEWIACGCNGGYVERVERCGNELHSDHDMNKRIVRDQNYWGYD